MWTDDGVMSFSVLCKIDGHDDDRGRRWGEDPWEPKEKQEMTTKFRDKVGKT